MSGKGKRTRSTSSHEIEVLVRGVFKTTGPSVLLISEISSEAGLLKSHRTRLYE